MYDFRIIEEVGLKADQFDPNRLDRQLKGYNKWRIDCKGHGILQWCTGAGKTLPSIIAILRLNKFAPGEFTNVIVPTEKLQKDWIGKDGHIERFKLKNVRVFVINTYTIYNLNLELYTCYLLVIDECHRAGRSESKFFSQTLDITKCKARMLLSATLNEDQIAFFDSYGIKIADTITIEEAQKNNYVSPYDLYNYSVSIEDEKAKKLKDYDDIVNSNFGKFQYDYKLMTACTVGNAVPFYHPQYGRKTGKEWKKWYSQQMGGNPDDLEDVWSIKNISKYANTCNWAIRERQELLFNLEEKIFLIKEIVNHFPVPTIVFCESTHFADKVVNSLGSIAKAYHSNIPSEVYYSGKLIAISEKLDGDKIRYKCLLNNKYYSYSELSKLYKGCTRLGTDKVKEKIFHDLKIGKIRVIVCVKALNEGVDIPSIEVGIVASGKSTEIDNTQRSGRILRIDYDNPTKRALLINLYVPNSQDEKWLKNRQKSIPEYKIRWINNINQIKREEEQTSML
jgi:superfamily II DNA or RNA helicase